MSVLVYVPSAITECAARIQMGWDIWVDYNHNAMGSVLLQEVIVYL